MLLSFFVCVEIKFDKTLSTICIFRKTKVKTKIGWKMTKMVLVQTGTSKSYSNTRLHCEREDTYALYEIRKWR